MADGVGHAHPVLPPEAELRVPLGPSVVIMPPSPVVTSFRGWKEKQATSPCGLPIRSQPAPTRISLPMAQAASSITGRPWRRAIADDGRQVAGHPHLMDAKDRPGPVGDGGLDPRRIDVEGLGLDVHEDRDRAAVADAVGRGDEGVADGDDFVPGADADGQQRQVQGRRATGHGAGVLGPDPRCELTLERGDLRPLGDPAGTKRRGDGLDLGIADRRTRQRGWSRS